MPQSKIPNPKPPSLSPNPLIPAQIGRWAIPAAAIAGVFFLFLCGLLLTTLVRSSNQGEQFVPASPAVIITQPPTVPPYHEITATLSGRQWTWTISVERLTAVSQTGLSVPAGGRLLNQTQVIDRYEQVLDHYDTQTIQIPEQVQVGVRTYVCGQRDLGNGFFEDIECTDPIYETRYRTETSQQPVYRSDPVYVTQYSYEIDQWVYIREEQASGTAEEPFWPAVTLAADEREGGRSQHYEVQFTDAAGNLYTWTTDEAGWRTASLGNTHRLEVNDFGTVFEVLD